MRNDEKDLQDRSILESNEDSEEYLHAPSNGATNHRKATIIVRRNLDEYVMVIVAF
jgi:hypothetical protein